MSCSTDRSAVQPAVQRCILRPSVQLCNCHACPAGSLLQILPPTHPLQVQRYLEAFADEFHLRQHVRLGTEVQRLTPISASSSSSSDAGGSTEAPPDWLRWEVTSRPVQRQHGQQHGASASSSSSSSVGSTTERFDAAIIASGHYSRPRLPQIPGQDVFPGRVMHSHNYRRPECYAGQTVVLLGASSSGVDIAEEIANAGAKR